MIITQTPFRMSFFGGGTDMESFFRENGGAVLSTTFDKYCYVNVRHLPRFFDYSTELSYSKTERVTCIEDIQHPAIRNAMKMLDIVRTMGLGGTENVVLQLCEILSGKVNKIVVCSSGGVHEKKLQEMGIKHYLIPDIASKNPMDMLKSCRSSCRNFSLLCTRKTGCTLKPS